MTHTTEALERPAWGVWVDYKIAPPGSYACLVSRFMDNRWTDPEPQWMPAQLRPQLYGEVKVMPYLMPNDPLAAVNALPELLALRKENERLREALEKIANGKYGKCPIEGHWPPEKPCTLCGDLGFFDDDPRYNPNKDGHCVEGGARVVARAALSQEAGS